MTALVFAVGVLLALAGVVSVISGAPIMQIERGWTEVIAGTVAVCGGVVTVAIGVVLLRLRAIGDSLRSASLPSLTTAPVVLPEPALPVERTGADLRPTRAPEDTVFVASGEGEVHTQGPGGEPADGEPARVESPGRSWKLRRERTDKPAESEPVVAVAPPVVDEASAVDPAPVEAVPQAEEPVHALEAESQAPASITPEPEDETPSSRRLVAASSALPAPASAPPVRQSFFQDWRSKPLLRSRQPAVTPPEIPPPLFDALPPGDAEAPPVDLPAEAIADQSPAVSIDAPAVEEPSKADEPAVIGRYQAGASSYTMYADGAIDVETESGDRHRFASMDELKAFIARQEQAVT